MSNVPELRRSIRLSHGVAGLLRLHHLRVGVTSPTVFRGSVEDKFGSVARRAWQP